MTARRPFSSARFGPFRGRAEEAALLRAMLAGKAPIITVTGLPGVGKTRLVAHVVGDDAVWVTPTEIMQGDGFAPVLERCALKAGEGMSGDGPITVVIDGLEHTDLIVPLTEFVDDNPLLRFVVTSRLQLGARGSASLRLTPFELPSRAAVMAAHPDRWPAVECFLDNATAADAAFQLTTANAMHVLDLLRASGGLPLGIELTTAWIGSMPIQALAWAATDPSRFHKEREDLLDLEPSQRNLTLTLQAAVAHIPPEARPLANAIAEFRGPAPLDALGQIIGSDVLRDQLLDLAASNLVWTSEVDSLVHVHMLPIVAQHLRDHRIDTRLQERYLDWLTEHVAENASLLGTSSNATAVAALSPHVDGLPDLATLFPGGDERAAAITLALLPYWRSGSQYHEADRRVDSARRQLPKNHALAPWLTLAAGRAQRDVGDLAVARQVAITILRDKSLPPEVRAMASVEVFHVNRHALEPLDASLLDTGRRLFEECSEIDVPGCVKRWFSDVPTALAIQHADSLNMRGERAAARTAYQALIEALEATDDLQGLSWALYELTDVLQEDGPEADHLSTLNRVTEITRLLGPRSTGLSDRMNSALVHAGYGHHDAARADAIRLLDEVQSLEAPFFVEQGYRALGLTFAETGDTFLARAALSSALAMTDVLGVGHARAIAAVAIAAPPVGPQLDTRNLLARAACAADPSAIAKWWGPWKARIDALDIESPPILSLADAVALAVTTLESSDDTVVPKQSLPHLTRREREVVMLLAEGLSDREISGRLVMSTRTAEAHVAAILRKLGVPNRKAAAEFGRQAGCQPSSGPREPVVPS